MHSWSSDWPYFADVEEAAAFIGDYCRKWGRINVTQTKEKFGQCRVYCHFGMSSLHGLLYPGYIYTRVPNWLAHFTDPIISLIGSFSAIGKYQEWIYRRAYTKAIVKFPHITPEILEAADYPEFLTLPGIYKYLNAPKLCGRHSMVGKSPSTCYLNERECTKCAQLYQRLRAFKKKACR